MKSRVKISALWTPISPASTIKLHHGRGNRPRRITLHDGKQRLAVFWDDRHNTAAIVDDTCQHRGVSLSSGRVDRGCVVCPYHGRKTTPNDDRVTIADGIVWYNDPTFESSETSTHTSWEFEQGQRICIYERRFPGCNPVYTLENTIDWEHLRHVHLFSFTRGDPEVIIHEDGTAASYVYTTAVPGHVLEVENQFWTNASCLRFRFGPRDAAREDREVYFSIHSAFVPVGKRDTTVILRVARRRLAWLGPLGDLVMMASNELPIIEDRAILQTIPHDHTWRHDTLSREDGFIGAFRDHLRNTVPGMVELYCT